MGDTFIYDFLKFRLKKHRVHFRKPIPLKNYEKAILGIIANKEGELSYLELGRTLGFAIEDDRNSNIRKDKAEIEIFETYLNDLKCSHLLEFDREFIILSDWGLRALKENRKFGFYKGNIQIPNFLIFIALIIHVLFRHGDLAFLQLSPIRFKRNQFGRLNRISIH
jgi:hypothetical protein